jgi:hypothetical protein
VLIQQEKDSQANDHQETDAQLAMMRCVSRSKQSVALARKSVWQLALTPSHEGCEIFINAYSNELLWGEKTLVFFLILTQLSISG